MKTETGEVRCWTNDPNNFIELREWGNGKIGSASPLVWQRPTSFCLQVETDGGFKLARINDWIIKFPNGSFDVLPNNQQ